MRPNKKALNINLLTIIAVYFLILIGGIVRSMGAGMGCPDWPKCFGEYIPPTDNASLPENYEQIYVDLRVKKNLRLSNTLNFLGFSELSAKVTNDPKILEATYFDVEKAWVEYLNRLVGVTIGILIILNMWFSFRYWNEHRAVTWIAIASFVLVLFQGWIGSLVVSTNLIPGFISFHMALALLMVALLLVQRIWMTSSNRMAVMGKYVLGILLVLFGIQVLMGVQVREQIDLIKSTTDLSRSSWVDSLSSIFYIHRTYSLLLMALIAYLFYINYKSGQLNILLYLLVGTVVVEIILGAVLSYFSMPAAIQPVHLLLGTVAFGVIFYLFLSTNYKLKQQ